MDTDGSGKIPADNVLAIGAAWTILVSTCGAAVTEVYWVRAMGIAFNPELMIVDPATFVVLVIVFKDIGAGEAFSCCRLACHALESKVASAGRKAVISGLVAILVSNFIGAALMMRVGSISIAVRRIGAAVDMETTSETVERIGDGVTDMMLAGSISTAERMTGGAAVEPVTM